MTPLTIIHVLRAPMGGVMRHVRDLARLHSAQGHKVGIICDVEGTPGYNNALLEALDKELAYGVMRLPMSRSVGPSDYLAIRKIDALLHAINPDVVHGHGAKGGVYARLCGNNPLARIYSPHGGSLHFDPAKLSGKVYFAVEKWLEKRTSRMLFVADFERRTYEEKIGKLQCAWTVSYNGLAKAEFEPVKQVDAPVDFLFIGEIRLLKGPDLFIDALKALNTKRDKPVTGLMVGAGPDTDAMRHAIEEAGLTSTITMQGPMPAREAFSQAKTVVIPSRAEAMPYIVLEALAGGCPVITTRVGGIPEIMGAANSALIEPEAVALEQAMAHALDDPANFKASLPSVEALQARFSDNVMADAVMLAYRETVSGKGVPNQD